MFIKSACILTGLVAFWFGAFFAFPGSFAVRPAGHPHAVLAQL
jgi:hypothetical protein